MSEIEKVCDEDGLIELHNTLLAVASLESVRHLLPSTEPESQPGQLTLENCAQEK
jgi:hypothetical protein